MTTTTPSPAPAASPWTVSSLLSALTKVGPPLTIVTALLIYFGWARANAQSKAMGIDVSMFGYTTQDYVLRSISTLYLPLLVLAGLGLAWLMLDRRLTGLSEDESHRAALWRGGLWTSIAGAAAAIGAALAAWVLPTDDPLVLPLLVAAGTAVAAYGHHVRRMTDPSGDTQQTAASERATRAVLIGGVITLAMFWELSSFAGVVGRGYAERLARSVGELPRVTVTSPDPLGVEAPGVTETAVTLPAASGTPTVRYRTNGLRLLVDSGGRVFLLNDGWRPGRGVLVVLPDNDKLHWQLSR